MFEAPAAGKGVFDLCVKLFFMEHVVSFRFRKQKCVFVLHDSAQHVLLHSGTVEVIAAPFAHSALHRWNVATKISSNL